MIASKYADPDHDPLPNAAAQARLEFLDGLRGLAALAVFLTHAGAVVWQPYRDFLFSRFELGNFGVILFFLCSGFIIPVSLERQSSLRRFWIRRICRLYPLYWFNIALILLLSDDFGFNGEQHLISGYPVGMVLANLSMLHMFLGYKHLSTVFWTLFWELLFYIIVSGLYLTRQNGRTVPITVGLLVTAIMVETVLPLMGGMRYPPGQIGFIATMFFGTVLYHGSSGEIPPRTVLAIAVLTLIMLAVTALGDLHSDPWAHLHLLTARMVAFVVFCLAFLLRTRPTSSALLYLGRISYSLYLACYAADAAA